MSVPFYRATFEKQLTGSEFGGKNCSMASAAMLADQSTLKLTDPTPDRLRALSGDTEGGLLISQVGSVLAKVGVHVTVYDASDGYTFDRLVADLRRGRFAVVNGDYDVVPDALAGSRTFEDLHSEFWHRATSTGIVVGDPLCDGRRPGYPKGYVTYPLDIARRYVEKFDRQVPGNGIHAAVMDLKRVRSRVANANIRQAATRSSAVLGTFSGTATLVWGGTVKGESVVGNNVWYRVWYPAKATLAYVHDSVVVRV